MTGPELRHVHLFQANHLLATIETTDVRPAEHYEVDGRRYRAVTYMEVTEQSGRRAFDVQVAALDD